MKKNFILALPCIAAVAFATFVGKKALEASACESNSLLMQNVEALAQNEFPDGWRPGFSIATVWYSESASLGFEFSVTEPDIWAKLSKTWKTLKCCMRSVDSNACDFNAEESKCKNTAIR